MNNPDFEDEPLSNIDLESAVLGLRMALTPGEEVEARQKFLSILRDSMLAVPMADPNAAPTNGSKPPEHDVQLIVAENSEGVNGVPAFTTVASLRATLPQAPTCTFLRGAQIAAMLADSPFKLFIDGPDLHAEVDHDEMKAIVKAMEGIMELQQEAAQHNTYLEESLSSLAADPHGELVERVAKAFMTGFCTIPLAGENDEGAECIMMTAAEPTTEDVPQEIAILTVNGALMCFTSEEMVRNWNALPRNVMPIPGPAILQIAHHAGVTEIHLNPGSPNGCTLIPGPDGVSVKR